MVDGRCTEGHLSSRLGLTVLRAESRVRVISGSPRPAWHPSGGEGAQVGGGIGVQGAVGGPVQAGLRAGWRPTGPDG